MPNVPMRSSSEPVSNNWFGDFPKSRYLRKFKEINELRSYFAPRSLYAAQPMNLGFLDWGTALGFKGHVCKKCLSFEFKQIFDDVKNPSLKSNHICNPQKLSAHDL